MKSTEFTPATPFSPSNPFSVRILVFLLASCLFAPVMKATDPNKPLDSSTNTHKSANSAKVVTRYFQMQEPEIQTEKITFRYHAEFGGMTHVILKNDAGKVLWQGQYPIEAGENSLNFKTQPLAAGVNYSFCFSFKQEEVVRTVSLPVQ